MVLPATRDPRRADCPSIRPCGRSLRQIANPLTLGEMGVDATHFVLGQHWKTHFTEKPPRRAARWMSRCSAKWIDDPRPMGLPDGRRRKAVILLFAAQTNRTFYLHGLARRCEPFDAHRPPRAAQTTVPPQDVWDIAVQRAATSWRGRISALQCIERGQAEHDRQNAGNGSTSCL